ncbi:MAG: hydroxyacylglutathione hydrolase [Gammaproteobacteria bacterium]|nr:hydroxyacylglutathione hydrolase [Gammaproteobacteria bacterium]
MLKVHRLPCFEDNYIWLIQGVGSSASSAVIVDPGDATPVMAALEQLRLTPEAILVTHHHADHVGGITTILQHYAMPVYGPANETIAGVSHPVGEGDCIGLLGDQCRLEVLDLPGHTRGHVAYYGDGMLFCGDTLFAGGCGRLLGGTAAQLFRSLQKIAALPNNTALYCAHEYTAANLKFALQVEPNNAALLQRSMQCERLRQEHEASVPSLLALEKQTNPFLRTEKSSIIQAAEGYAGRQLVPGEGVFALLRYWKDCF